MALFGKNFIIAFIRPRTDFFSLWNKTSILTAPVSVKASSVAAWVCDCSLRDLAKLSGVSASHILRIESGEYDFQVETLLKIAIHLGVPLWTPARGRTRGKLAVRFMHWCKPIPPWWVARRRAYKPGVAGPWLEAVRFVAAGVRGHYQTALVQQSVDKLATRFDYPFSHLEDGFIKAAATIEQTHSADRAAMLRQLRKAPVDTTGRIWSASPEGFVALEISAAF